LKARHKGLEDEAKGSWLGKKCVRGLQNLAFLLEAMVVIPAGALISFMPMKLCGILARLGGALLFNLGKKGRRIAYHNLDVIFSENPLTDQEKERILRKLFVNLTLTALEYLKIGDLTAQNDEQFTRAKEELDHVLEMNKGSINISAHIGNWEVLASASAKLGQNTAAMINRQLNPYTDKWLKSIRENKGMVKCYYNETSGLMGIVRHLKRNGIVGILADEAASSAAVQVPFFGRETVTTSGPAQLHLRYGAPIMFYSCVRESDEKFLVYSDGPYHFEKSGDFENDCRIIMTLVNQKYEAIIRKYPDQWFSLLYPRWGKEEPVTRNPQPATFRSRPQKGRKRQIGFGQRLLFLLEAMFVIPLGTLISCLPWNTARAVARLAGLLMFHLDKRDKRQAYYNLDLIHAENPLSQEEKHTIVRRLFSNVAMGAVEFLKLADLRADNYEEFVEVGDYAPLLRALEAGKGVLAITAHLGNWEYLGSVVAKLGLNVAAIIKRQHNPYTDEWLKDFREDKGKVKCFYKDSSTVVHVDRHLKQNGVLGFMVDQRELARPILVPFLGMECLTHDEPARLHLWYEAPLVMCFAVKRNSGKYHLWAEGPYHFRRTGDTDRDCRKIMTWVNLQYEEVIRKHPDQWFSLMTPRWGHAPKS
jgi:Kdo2-lipid IVA lauroyltransferase/acyltransferase